MDQMVSGSGLYPIRLLDDSWFSQQELQMIVQLERILRDTMQAPNLARDMLAPLIYDLDVRIILDNSGSMQLDMFGNAISEYGNRSFDIEAENRGYDNQVKQALD